MVVGFAQKNDNLDGTRNLVDEIVKSQQEDAVRTLGLCIIAIKRVSDACHH